MNPLRQLLKSAGSHAPLGTWLLSASPIVVEAIGHAGFDWGVLDMEHAPLDLMGLVHLLQAVGNTKMVPVVRVPWNDTVTVKRVLDAGAQTLLFPFVQNADEARRAVAATRYPPEGVRGMAGMSRGSKFGTTPDYFQAANKNMGVIAQLETPEAVANLESIAAVPGVDALFVGPADLSGSMGHAGQLAHPAVMSLMAGAAQRCQAIDMPMGTVGDTPEAVVQYRAAGYTFVAIASDLGLLMRGARAAVKALTTPEGETHVHTLAGGTQTPRG
ncbi:MAG: aldolase/citrate lyase family protein [Rubrivivax sp.]|nr:aldolase/citrate lyase family protein [Rubrivivax sp.]